MELDSLAADGGRVPTRSELSIQTKHTAYISHFSSTRLSNRGFTAEEVAKVGECMCSVERGNTHFRQFYHSINADGGPASCSTTSVDDLLSHGLAKNTL
jgi:hypothetical protein